MSQVLETESQFLSFTSDIADLTIAAQADNSEQKLRSFSMTAYNGGPMPLGGFYYPVIVDLAGMSVKSQNKPILYSHDRTQIVGHSETIKVTGKSILVTGKISGIGDAAKEVTQLSKNGFPWQASIGAESSQIEFVERGNKVKVNGASWDGPVYVARKTSLREISFAALGADDTTSASVAASLPKGSKTMSTDTLDKTSIIQAERDRVAKIEAACKGDFGNMQNRVAELRAQAIDETITFSDLQAGLLHCIRASRPQAPSVHSVQHEQSNQVLEAGLMIRAGHEDLAVKAYGEQAVTAARRDRITNLVDLCAASLRANMVDVPRDREAVIKAAFSADFTTKMFANIMGKVAFEAYKPMTEGWRTIASIKSAENFHEQTGIRPSHFDSLEAVAPDGEIKHTILKEEANYNWQVGQYAKMIGITRVTIINDDLSFVDSFPKLFGMAAARSLNDLFWKIVMGGEASSFFSTANKNLRTWATDDITTLLAAVAAFKSQTDSKGDNIDLSPETVVVSNQLEGNMRSLLNSTETTTVVVKGKTADSTGELSARPTGNPAYGIIKNMHSEARLSNTKFAGYADNDYYLFAPSYSDAVIVGFLQGQQTPRIETEDAPFNQLGVQMRAVFDYGVALGDPKGAMKVKKT